ncbi:Trm112 family protein [Fibrobacter sp. UBA4309]|uniref:Trm112 family protein n=1 Tax=Fibrobacter sp. UBA4309 TaxID=1946537 RepID=UPI0025C0615E|nr:Trm112 family protein [Fibrobacter sp. UBA4309]
MVDYKGLMFDTNLLDILCCPVTRASLKLADDSCLQSLNRAIDAGTLKNAAGETVSEKMEEALVSADGKRAYPVREGIPVLLSDEAILLPVGA